MTATQLRRAWLEFFERNGHTTVASSGLIPTHPTAPLFTNAGMNQFVPYFLGEQPAPYPRATSVQKCVRTGDIDIVGTTTRHLTFFEMLGNFSFGDYFKEGAIQLAWEMSTEVLGLDGDRIWATVFLDDDEAADIWRDTIGLPAERIQRLGEEDNFWEMQKGRPGPCAPCSELYYDRGAEYGADGGPEHGGEERFLEYWNLVFMQYNRLADGSLVDLPSKSVDTGAGFERNLALMQGVETVFDTDALAPLLEVSQRLADVRYGAADRSDVSLRIMADHARTVSFLVSDGVFPSNEGRGYVLRRLIRRAVRHAYLLGVESLVTPDLVDTTVEIMGESYPDLVKDHTFVRDVVVREEERFRSSLKAGLSILEAEMATLAEGDDLSGSVTFLLHDTHGFPFDVTREIAGERGIGIDESGFEAEMAEQRRRAKAARRSDGAQAGDAFAALLDEFGETDFTGRDENESKARLLAVVDTGDGTTAGDVSDGVASELSVVLDRSPFYAESGGQVGDTGRIVSDTATARVTNTVYGAPGLHRHVLADVEGEFIAGQDVTASIDVERRDAIRRNHTATHLLHYALREVLGEHVKQQGSHVGPDRLRFDFSHYEPVTADEMTRIEDLVNRDVLANEPARHFETTKDFAEQLGAIAFFGEKYGDTVRVLEAGPHSTELCGGTHVGRLGDIGPVKITSESSIGSNLRRIEAVSGFGPIDLLRADETKIIDAATLLGVASDDLVGAVERRVTENKELRDELKALKRQMATAGSDDLVAAAIDGVVVARVDGLDREHLRDLALLVRDHPDVRAVVLGGAPGGGGASMVAAVTTDSGLHASELIADAAKLVKGGTGKNAELAVAGGKDAAALDDALDLVRSAAGLPAGS